MHSIKEQRLCSFYSDIHKQNACLISHYFFKKITNSLFKKKLFQTLEKVEGETEEVEEEKDKEGEKEEEDEEAAGEEEEIYDEDDLEEVNKTNHLFLIHRNPVFQLRDFLLHSRTLTVFFFVWLFGMLYQTVCRNRISKMQKQKQLQAKLEGIQELQMKRSFLHAR